MHWDAATTRRRVGDERKALATELSTAHSSLERGPDAVAAEFAASYDRLQSLNARMHAPAAQPAGLIVTGIIAFLLAAFIPAGLTQNVAVGALFGAAGAGAAVFLIKRQTSSIQIAIQSEGVRLAQVKALRDQPIQERLQERLDELAVSLDLKNREFEELGKRPRRTP